jgi:hypothetical protein
MLLYVPVSLLLGGGLTRNIPAVENDDGRNLMVPKQIDSVHKVFQESHFLIAI